MRIFACSLLALCLAASTAATPVASGDAQQESRDAAGAPRSLDAGSASAAERTDTVTQKLGAHTYVIPRDILELIYTPDYSRDPHPNPNWSREPVIRLFVHWPDFKSPRGINQFGIMEHVVNITLLDLIGHPITSVEQITKNLSEANEHPIKIPADYDLIEFKTDLSQAISRDFIGTTPGGYELYIHCDVPDSKFEGKINYFCEYNFPYFDAAVNVHFGWIYLRNWKDIYVSAVGLLDSMKKG